MSDLDINFPTADLKKIYDKEPNRFLIVTAVAKRARQLKDGAKPMIEFNQDLPMGFVHIAVKELELNKYQVFMKEVEKVEEEILHEMDKSLDDSLEKEKDTTEKDKKKEKTKSRKSLAA